MSVVPEKFAMLLYQHITEYCSRTGKTQGEIALSIGRSGPWLSRLINARPGPSPDRVLVLVIAARLKLSVEECNTLLRAIEFDAINKDDAYLFSFVAIGVRDSAEVPFIKEVALEDYEVLLSALTLYEGMISSTHELHQRSLEQSLPSALELSDRLGRIGHRLQALRILITAEMFERAGSHIQARREYLSALKEARASRDRVAESLIHMKLGDLACNRGEESDAKCQYEQAGEILVLARTLDGLAHPFLNLLATKIDRRMLAVSESRDS